MNQNISTCYFPVSENPNNSRGSPKIRCHTTLLWTTQSSSHRLLESTGQRQLVTRRAASGRRLPGVNFTANKKDSLLNITNFVPYSPTYPLAFFYWGLQIKIVYIFLTGVRK